MLAPLAPTVIGSAAHAADIGAIDWIKRPAPWAPLALFNKATGSFAFPVMVALAVWGVMRGWRRWRTAIIFALLWMWAPPLLLMVVSYAIRPAFVERYLLSCFVPFFILVAIGIVEIPRQSARLGAIALMVALAIGHVIAWDRKPHDAQWREAVTRGDDQLGYWRHGGGGSRICDQRGGLLPVAESARAAGASGCRRRHRTGRSSDYRRSGSCAGDGGGARS